MSANERRVFIAWYDGHKVNVLDNKRVFESFCRDEVNLLRGMSSVEARIPTHRERRRVLVSTTTASTCNKLMRKRFLKLT